MPRDSWPLETLWFLETHEYLEILDLSVTQWSLETVGLLETHGSLETLDPWVPCYPGFLERHESLETLGSLETVRSLETLGF